MKPTFLTLLLGLLLCSGSLAAQSVTTTETSTVEMTPQELATMTRRLIELRRQRYLAYRQEYVRRMRILARPRATRQLVPIQSVMPQTERNSRQKQGQGLSRQLTVTVQTENDTIITIDPVTYQRSVTVVPRRPAVDTVISIDPTTYRQTMTIVPRRPAMDTIVTIDPRTYQRALTVVPRQPATDTIIIIDPVTGARTRRVIPTEKIARATTTSRAEDDYGRELALLRQQLDRQEVLLRDLASRSEPATYPSVFTPPQAYRTDTIVQRIIDRSDDKNALSRNDLDDLTREVRRMNREMDDLRRQLRNEEDRRRRAERNLERSIDDRRRDVSPTVITQPARIVRDTVFVDRTRTEPVLIPATPDTVIQVREVIRESAPVVIRDTVVQERETRVVETREVVRTDTVKLSPTEPLSFPTIFFDNNSSALNANHRAILASTARQLANNRGYELRLIGYASPSGSAAYNQQLSARRAAAVRQGLEDAGLPADRIVIVPGGIDYKPASPAAARRVEIQALPR